MAAFDYSFRAVLASITILSGTALSIAFFSNTFGDSASAASKASAKGNFAAKCDRVYGNASVKALAVEETLSYQQICVCARTNRDLRRQLNAAGVTCTNNQITNFNQPTISGEPPGGPNPPPGATLTGFNPGNHKNVGKAGETPPNGNGSAGKFGVDLSSAADNGNCCAGGDRGASNGNR
jgi:hypothetical protein